MATKKSQKTQSAPPKYALREEFMVGVRGSLERKGYRAEDFALEQTVEGSYVRLDIHYSFDDQFWLVAWVRAEADVVDPEPIGTISVSAVPGTLLREEGFTCKNKTELLSAISAWVQRVDAELRAIPVNRAVAEQRELIEELTRQFDQHSESAFTREEAQAHADRLDELEQRMEDSIRASVSAHDEANARVKKLHEEIELLKMQLGALSKAKWAKSAAIRIANWLKDPTNRQLLKSGSDVAKSLLLPPGNSHADAI